MADNDSQPPGWSFSEEPPPIPPAPPLQPVQPPPTAQPPAQQPPINYEPPVAYPPPAPAAPIPPPPVNYEPPVAYPPPAPAAPIPPPPVNYEPPVAYPPPAPAAPIPPPPAAYPPPTSNKKNVFITIAVIAGIFLLGIGSCTVWFVNTVKAPVDEANRFLALIDDADYQGAAAMVPVGCDGNAVDAAGLEELFGGQPISYDLKNSQITNSNATVSGAFSSEFRPSRSIEVYLRNRDGWSVCGFQFGA